MSGNPQPMTMTDPFDYEDARQAMKASAAAIRSAETELSDQIDRAADAERDYRRAVAARIITLRSEGASATLAKDLARGDEEVLTYSHARDIAAGMVKFRHEVLEDRRGDRASLHKVVDWSMKVAPSSDPRREYEPPIGAARSG